MFKEVWIFYSPPVHASIQERSFSISIVRSSSGPNCDRSPSEAWTASGLASLNICSPYRLTASHHSAVNVCYVFRSEVIPVRLKSRLSIKSGLGQSTHLFKLAGDLCPRCRRRSTIWAKDSNHPSEAGFGSIESCLGWIGLLLVQLLQLSVHLGGQPAQRAVP